MVMKRKPKLWNVCRSVEDRIHTWDVRFPGRERGRKGYSASAIVLMSRLETLTWMN